jgi:hypothetical protein
MESHHDKHFPIRECLASRGLHSPSPSFSCHTRQQVHLVAGLPFRPLPKAGETRAKDNRLASVRYPRPS